MKIEIVAWLIFFGFIACVLVIPTLVILHKWDTILKPLESVVDYLVEEGLKSLPSAQPEDYTELKREFLRNEIERKVKGALWT